MEKADIEKLNDIFFPQTQSRIREFKESASRFVHYTSAEAAMNIRRKREFWMREPTCMNDFSEVQHGLNCIIRTYRGDQAGLRFQEALNGLFDGVTTHIERNFDLSVPTLKAESYLACLSEHLQSGREDEFGRLSMWRAYCGNSGVAIVMNAAPILDGPGVLKVVTSPVEYLDDAGFARVLEKIAENIRNETEYLKRFGRDGVVNVVLAMLRIAALSTKHPGFHEEREWRVIYSPIFESTSNLERSIESVSGIPQTVLKLPLKSLPDGRATGAELPGLIDKIVIGPTQYPLAIHKAFVNLLREAEVPDPEKKVVISWLPLRR
jgi:hypothetical protein